MGVSINNLKFIIKILADIAIVYISLYLAIIINAEIFTYIKIISSIRFHNYLDSNNDSLFF